MDEKGIILWSRWLYREPAPSMPLKKGLKITYAWIEEQAEKDKRILISNRKG